MALVTLKDVHKHFADRHLLRGVSLVVPDDARIGLVGPNGAGKTTLLRILAGLEEFEDGERTQQRGLRFVYLEQEPHVDPARTVAEVVGEGHEAAAVIDRVGLSPDAVCGELSGGEIRRAALAHILARPPGLLLLDEPTNHLDAFVTQWLEDYLIAARIPVVMVTHDRYFLDRVCDKIVELDRGALYKTEGGYAEFLAARAMRHATEKKSETARLSLLRREAVWMRKSPHGRTTKAKARIRRFEALTSAAPENTPADVDLTIPSGPRLGTKVVRLRGIGKYGVLKDLDLDIGPGDRIGIVGPNGAGKTTLLKLATGALAPDAGRVETGPTVKFAYIDQARADLNPDESVLRAIAGENVWVRVGERDVRIEGFLDRFLFPRKMHDSPVGKLSGGERNRVLLAKLLIAGGNVLLLDEPTNDLDLITLRVLEEALLEFPGAVLVVSHDRYFLDRVATRILYLDGRGGRAREHPGDMSSLLDALKREPRATAKKAKPARERPRSARKLSYHEQRELEQLPDRIGELETELAAIDARLSEPEAYRRSGIREITARRAELAAALEKHYARWEELESLR